MIEIFDFYAALVESSDDAVVAKDTTGIVVGWNPAAERLFGYTADEMIGQSIRRLLPPDRQEEEDRILERIRAGDRVGQFFTVRQHKSGRLIDVSITVSPVRDANGTIVGASKFARDAGPHLAHQRQLRESEERFRMLAENISPFAWIADADGSLFWYNQRWYDYTGTTLEEMQGWGWRSVHHPDHAARVEAGYREALANGTDWEDTFPLRGHDGTYRWYLSRAKPIRDEQGKVIRWFGTNTDITEQREQAEQIRILLMEVNHRSKNLLSMVQALARRTAENGAVPLAAFEDRLRSLAVNQDILVSREWREVPLRELVQGQLKFLEKVQGEVSFAGPNCALKPRAAEIVGMALHELATNSLKYGALSVPDGKVDVLWELDPAQDRFTIRWQEKGGPPAKTPEKNGFGTTLIRDVPRRSLGAEVTMDFGEEGLSWNLACPANSIAVTLQAAA